MAGQERGEDEQGTKVSEVGGSSSQPFNIENAFQFVMTKLTTIELEQVQFREFVTHRFDEIDERQEAIFDEIQNIRTMQQDLEYSFPQS